MAYNIFNFIQKQTLKVFCKKYHIQKLSLFGSALREELRPESDIDLLVEFEESYIPGIITLAGIANELSHLLKRNVDLRTPHELSGYFRDDVIREAEIQYEAG